MSMNGILTQLRKEGKRYSTSEELREYSRKLYYNYENVIRYLVSQREIIKIFPDLYYIRSKDEMEFKKSDFSLLEIVGKALDLKNIDNWYFGIYTALRINEIPYKNEKDIYLINDNLSKDKPIKINGHLFRIIRLKPSLFEFGIKSNKIKYSDPEKTILDLIYLLKSSGMVEMRIVLQISSYMKYVLKDKIMSYSEHYPVSNKAVLDRYYEGISITT